MSAYKIDNLLAKIEDKTNTNTYGTALGLIAIAYAISNLAEVIDRKRL